MLTHAVMDALLGAAALGDIGAHFPDTDERWRDADSIALLRDVRRLLRRSGLGGAEPGRDRDLRGAEARPASRRDARRGWPQAAGLEPDAVSVKFTTNEGMGFVGRGEGIAALAVASRQRRLSRTPEPPRTVSRRR